MRNFLTDAEREHFKKLNRRWLFKDGQVLEVKNDELERQTIPKNKLASYPPKKSCKRYANQKTS